MQYIKNNIINIFFISLFLILPQIKLINSGNTFYDLSIYFQKIFNEEFELINYTFEHFEPLLIIFYLFKFILNEQYLPKILLLAQSIILLIPFFHIKEKKLKFIYLFCFTLWNVNFLDFHSDAILFVILFYIHYYLLNFSQNKLNIFYVIGFLTKEIFFLFFLPILIIKKFLYNKKITIFELTLLISSFFIFFLYIFLFQRNTSEIFSETESSNFIVNKINLLLNNINDTKYIAYFVLILFVYLLFFYKENIKVIKYFAICNIPYLLILILTGSINHINITNHYIALMFPPLLVSIHNSNYFKLKQIIFLIHFLMISSFPLSILSITGLKNTFSFTNYLFNLDDIDYRDYLIKNYSKMSNENISISNYGINDISASFNKSKPFPQNINKSKYIIINKNMRSIEDKLVDNNDKLLNLYNDNINFLNSNFLIIFQNDKFTIFQKKL